MSRLASLSVTRVLAALGALLLLAVVGRAFSLQQPAQQDAERRPHPRWFTYHDYGIQARVQPPEPASPTWTVSVLDLGPDVDGLRLDLAPTSATLEVSGRAPLALQPDGQGNLVTHVPRAWAPQGYSDRALLRVRHGAQLLLSFDAQQLFL